MGDPKEEGELSESGASSHYDDMVMKINNHSNEEFTAVTKELWENHHKEAQTYLLNPKQYPDFNKEWISFVQKRTEMIISFSGDTFSYNFESEFNTHWVRRLEEIMRNKWKKKLKLMEKLWKRRTTGIVDKVTTISKKFTDLDDQSSFTTSSSSGSESQGSKSHNRRTLKCKRKKKLCTKSPRISDDESSTASSCQNSAGNEASSSETLDNCKSDLSSTSSTSSPSLEESEGRSKSDSKSQCSSRSSMACDSPHTSGSKYYKLHRQRYYSGSSGRSGSSSRLSKSCAPKVSRTSLAQGSRSEYCPKSSSYSRSHSRSRKESETKSQKHFDDHVKEKEQQPATSKVKKREKGEEEDFTFRKSESTSSKRSKSRSASRNSKSISKSKDYISPSRENPGSQSICKVGSKSPSRERLRSKSRSLSLEHSTSKLHKTRSISKSPSRKNSNSKSPQRKRSKSISRKRLELRKSSRRSRSKQRYTKISRSKPSSSKRSASTENRRRSRSKSISRRKSKSRSSRKRSRSRPKRSRSRSYSRNRISNHNLKYSRKDQDNDRSELSKTKSVNGKGMTKESKSPVTQKILPSKKEQEIRLDCITTLEEEAAAAFIEEKHQIFGTSVKTEESLSPFEGPVQTHHFSGEKVDAHTVFTGLCGDFVSSKREEQISSPVKFEIPLDEIIPKEIENSFDYFSSGDSALLKTSQFQYGGITDITKYTGKNKVVTNITSCDSRCCDIKKQSFEEGSVKPNQGNLSAEKLSTMLIEIFIQLNPLKKNLGILACAVDSLLDTMKENVLKGGEALSFLARDCRLTLQLVQEKLRSISCSGTPSTEVEQKLVAEIQSLLDYASIAHPETSFSKRLYGLDMVQLAKSTKHQSPSEIKTFIRCALVYDGIINLDSGQVEEIYEALRKGREISNTK